MSRLWLPHGDATSSALREPSRLSGGKPEGLAVRLNQSNKFAQGLVGCYMFGSYVNLADPTNSLTEPAGWYGGEFFVDEYGTSVDYGEDSKALTGISPIAGFCAFAIVKVPIANDFRHECLGVYDNTSHYFSLGYHHSLGTKYIKLRYGAVSKEVVSPASVGDRTSIAVMHTSDGATGQLYENGAPAGTTFSVESIDSGELAIGGLYNSSTSGTSEYFNSNIYYVLLWQRGALARFSEAEMLDLHNDPYQMLTYAGAENQSLLLHTSQSGGAYEIILPGNDPIARVLRGG